MEFIPTGTVSTDYENGLTQTWHVEDMYLVY